MLNFTTNIFSVLPTDSAMLLSLFCNILCIDLHPLPFPHSSALITHIFLCCCISGKPGQWQVPHYSTGNYMSEQQLLLRWGSEREMQKL